MRPLIKLLLLTLLLTACGKPDKPTMGLYPAIHRGDINQIERHIKWGTDINQVDADGRRPLHVAAAQGEYVIARMLVKAGAEIDAPDRDGHSPLYVAIMASRPRVAELLAKLGASYDPDQLLDAVVERGLSQRDVIRLLVAWGANLNRRRADGSTPLIRAIRAGNRVLVKNLVQQGADVNLADATGNSPLAIATKVGNQEIVRLLRRNGARMLGSDA